MNKTANKIEKLKKSPEKNLEKSEQLNNINNSKTEDEGQNEKVSEKKRLNKKQKIVLIIISVILIIIVLVGAWYLYEKRQNEWSLLQDSIIVEYGEIYEFVLSDFVELNDNVTEENTKYNYELEYKEIVLQEETEDQEEITECLPYPEIGTYNIVILHTVEYKLFGRIVYSYDDEKIATLEVVDTTAPVFSDESPTEISTYKNVEVTDEVLASTFSSYVTDYDDVIFYIENNEETGINYEIIGNYEVQLIAEDASGNTSSMIITVIVNEAVTSVNITEANLTVGETLQLEVSIYGASQDVIYSSSDESIAMVDETGLITATSSGTATITITANEISATVFVNVTTGTSVSSGYTINGLTKEEWEEQKESIDEDVYEWVMEMFNSGLTSNITCNLDEIKYGGDWYDADEQAEAEAQIQASIEAYNNGKSN